MAEYVLLQIATWVWKKVEVAFFKSTWDPRGLLGFAVASAVRGTRYGGAFISSLWMNDLASWLVSYI